MSLSIDFARLRRSSNPSEYVPYLTELLNNSTAFEVSHTLISGVQRGSIWPSIAYVWLPLARCAASTRLFLEQDHSRTLRAAAIKDLGRVLSKAQSSRQVETLVDVPWLLRLLKTLAVDDVRRLAKVIQTRSSSRALQPHNWANDLLRGYMRGGEHFQRPLQHVVVRVLPLCSTDVVREYLPLWRQAKLDEKLLVDAHPDLLGQMLIENVFENRDYTLSSVDKIILSRQPSLELDDAARGTTHNVSVEILRRLAAGDKAGPKIDADSILDHIVAPAASRLIHRRRCDTEPLKHLFDLVLVIMDRHHLDWSQVLTKETPSGTWLRKNVFHTGPWMRRRFGKLAIEAWSQHPEIFEKHLARLVVASRKIKQQHWILALDDLHFIPGRLRLRLLTVIASNLSDVVGIESIDDLAKSGIRWWPCELFEWLPRDIGFGLLSKLQKMRGDNVLCYPNGSITDFEKVWISVGQGDQDAFQRVSQKIERTMGEAASSSDQSTRASKAQEVLQLAIDHQSPELLLNSTVWLKRFTKDPQTMRALLDERTQTALGSWEARYLVAGPILSDFWNQDRSGWVAKLEDQVLTGNKTLNTLLSYLPTLVREPSFQLRFIGDLWRLPWDAVKHRFKSLDAMMRKGLSAEDAEEYVIKPSIAMLLEAETALLQNVMDELIEERDFDWAQMEFTRQENTATQLLIAHLDTYARSRDQLWTSFRSKRNPEVVDLPKPMPRGLPITAILNEAEVKRQIDNCHKSSTSAYVLERARDIVFMPGGVAQTAIPADDLKIRRAIGKFYDSYKLALCVYIASCTSRAEQDRAFEDAWSHTIGPLTGERMSSSEAIRTWGTVFEEALPTVAKRLGHLLIESLQPPRVPVNQSSEQVLWNSHDGMDPEEQSRTLSPPTMIDITISGFGFYQMPEYSVADDLSDLELETEARKEPQIYDSCVTESLQGREAQIAASLLLLGHQWSLDTFRNPFPASDDIRYPVMSLDEASHNETHKKTRSMNRIMRYKVFSCGEAPIVLFKNMLEQLLRKLLSLPKDFESEARLEADTFKLMSLVRLSDTPKACTQLVIEACLSRPSSSSWHRQIMTCKLLRALDAQACKNFIMSFADALCSKMKEGKTKREASSAADTFAEAQPVVKVTTVKLFAEILKNPQFVDVGTSLDLLTRIFDNTDHLDARYAIVESILSVLDLCNTPSEADIVERIVMFLASKVVPIAGALNERRPLQDMKWKEAAGNSHMPRLSQEPPRLATLLRSPSTVTNPAIDSAVYSERVLVPLQRTMIESEGQWVSAFLSKQEAEDLQSALPPLPHDEALEAWWLKGNTHLMPRSTLEQVHRRILFLAQKPTQVVEFSKRVRQTTLYTESETHWLNIYDSAPPATLIEALATEVKPSCLGDGVDLTLLQQFAFDQAKSYLYAMQENIGPWNTFIAALKPKFARGEADQLSIWKLQAAPILERLVREIESIRSPAWQKNPLRKPGSLPDVLELRMQLLTHPLLPSSDTSADSRYANYGDELLLIFRGAVLGNSIAEPYHKHLETFKQYAAQGLDNDALWYLACKFGDIYQVSSWTLADILRVDIASFFVSKVDVNAGLSVEQKTQLVDVLNSWKECTNEYVRSEASELQRARHWRGWTSLWLE